MTPLNFIIAVGLTILRSTLAADAGWQEGRATWFDIYNNDLTTANCHFRWDQVKTGNYIGAFSDANPMFAKSCGMCIELRCQNAVIVDGYGESLDRSKSCRDPSRSIYVTIGDACPCDYPANQHSNKRWCCGDGRRPHIDITRDAFAQLADLSIGVIGLQYRIVDCNTPMPTFASFPPIVPVKQLADFDAMAAKLKQQLIVT
ncbi:RlpA-like double-psi beta-barrel-protein domain-containing protein-containing protein [Haematococcus lacustris]